MPGAKHGRALPFKHIVDQLDEIHELLHVPASTSRLAFDKVAKSHLLSFIYHGKLSTIFTNFDEIHTQAGLATKSFLAMYGHTVWRLTDDQIERDFLEWDLKSMMHAYFVWLLQVPLGETQSPAQDIGDALKQGRRRRALRAPGELPTGKLSKGKSLSKEFHCIMPGCDRAFPDPVDLSEHLEKFHLSDKGAQRRGEDS